MSQPTPTPLDNAIPFDNSVDGMFFSKMLHTAAKYWKVENKTLDIPSTEAIRRAISLIQSILTNNIQIEETR